MNTDKEPSQASMEEARKIVLKEKQRDQLVQQHDELVKEIGDFQQKAYELICKLSGKGVDGAGSDAGWQEFTLAEISEGLNHVIEQREKLQSELDEAATLIERLLEEPDAPVWKLAEEWLSRHARQGGKK